MIHGGITWRSVAFRQNALPRPTPALLATLVLLGIGLIPTTGDSVWVSALRSARSLEPNRADSAASATGYYVGLIDGSTKGRDELSLRLIGKPGSYINFAEIGATRFLEGSLLQFELLPEVDIQLDSARFTTNALGQRDRPYELAKPPGVYRIILLGSSMDMGWGVNTHETYENLFEDWLNQHAARQGVERRFEVHNLAMAAYSPLHRLDAFVKKAMRLEPDLVLYSATRLDTRLLQIHLVSLIQDGVDLQYPYLHELVVRAGAMRPGAAGQATTVDKSKLELKQRIEPHLWTIYEETIRQLASRCQSESLPLSMLIIPRASEEDGPATRGPDVDRLAALADKHGLPVLDVTDAFDDCDPAEVEIAPWDDHPNALGHRLLFRELARQLVLQPALYRQLFGIDPSTLTH